MTAYEHVAAAVAEILPKIPVDELRRHSPASVVATRLFAYIETATTTQLTELLGADELPAVLDAGDKRAKPWQIQVRFWNGEDLVGETDPEVIQGTGEIATMVAAVAADLHGTVPEELTVDAVKAHLPQLRNNLARQRAAVLRIKYEAADLEDDPVLAGRAVQYQCQVDVFRLS